MSEEHKNQLAREIEEAVESFCEATGVEMFAQVTNSRYAFQSSAWKDLYVKLAEFVAKKIDDEKVQMPRGD